MKPGKHVGFVIALSGLAMAGGSILVSQRQQSVVLRVERETMRLELAELERLRVENARLCASQIPAPELERLRADHAALPRLRAEFEALKPR